MYSDNKIFYQKHILNDTAKNIIFLHGFLASHTYFIPLLKQYKESYNVYMVDIRNHGQSCHSQEHNYPLLAQDIISIIEKENIYDAILLGHSMGGKLALQVLNDIPERIKAAIILDIVPRIYQIEPYMYAILQRVEELNLSQFHTRPDIKKAIQSIFYSLGHDDLVLWNSILFNISLQETGKYKFKFNQKIISQIYQRACDVPQLSQKIEQPVYILRGIKSDYIQADDYDLVKKHYQRSEIIDIDSNHVAFCNEALPQTLKELNIILSKIESDS